MGDKDLVSQCGDQRIAAVGGVGGNAARGFLERGQQKQTTRVQGGLPGARETHSVQGARRADDERLPATQEDVEAVPFDRGMEAADDGFALVAEAGGGIVGAQDGVAGTAGGAEQGGLAGGEQGRIADEPELPGGVRAEPFGQGRRPAGVGGRQAGYRIRHRCFALTACRIRPDQTPPAEPF